MNAKPNVLIVDDEEVVRLSYLRVLTQKHCSVEVVRNGADALVRMAQRQFDVVLLDLRMPGMNGIAVLKAIKSQWPECEVIVITGYPELDTAKQALMLGAYDYLSKPTGPDELANAAAGAMLHKSWALRCDQTALNQGAG